MRILLLRLESPLLAFGGVAVDAFGVIDDLPSASLLTGLLGNALGWQRTQTGELQALQDRLRFAVRIDRPGHRITDYQTADLHKSDQGWTTRGQPEGRAGGAGSYDGQHQRYRDFHADAAVTVALDLSPADVQPDIDALAHALDFPERPLFIGRKPCLPSGRLLLGVVERDSHLDALRSAEAADDADGSARCFIQTADLSALGSRRVHGLRNWASDVHQGSQFWAEEPRVITP
jgi:CRISPR system Cascade subunit CasD